MRIPEVIATHSRVALRGPVVSLASQVFGTAQLALVLVRAGANVATDAYFYLFSIGLLPTLIVIVGLMYPLLLNEERIPRSGLAHIRWVVPLLSVLFVFVGALWLQFSHRLGSALMLLVALSMANAAVQARLWFRAVAAEAGGSTVWISGVAVPANLLGVLLLLFPWSSSAQAVTAMTGGLLVGNVIFLAFMARRSVGNAVVASVDVERSGSRASYWFLAKSSTGYLGQALMQSLAVLLPASSLTFLNIAIKLVASASAMFINAVMPTVVHQSTDSTVAARGFLRIMLPLMACVALICLTATAIIRPAYFASVAILGIWLVATSAAAVAQRMSFRFLRPDATRVTLGVIVIVVGLALASSRVAGFNLNVLLCAYGAIDAAGAMLLLWQLKDRAVSLVMGAALISLAVIWGYALI
jgi:hypothetical protein